MKTKTLIWSAVIVISLGCGSLAAAMAWTSSQDGTRQRGGDNSQQTQEEDEDASEDTSEDASQSGPITAVVGGDIHTVTGAIIRGGTILMQDGKVLDVGQNLDVPEGANVIDAAGKVITPGFVAINMSGIGVGGGGRGGRGGGGGGGGNNNQLRDTLNPFDRNMKYALGVGITTGYVPMGGGGGGRGRRGRNGAPAERFLGLEPDPEELVTQEEIDFGPADTSVCPCCGLPILPTAPLTPDPPAPPEAQGHVVLKLSYGRLDPMIVKEDAFYSLSAGALSGPLNRHNWRENIKQARAQMAEQAENANQQAQTGGGRTGFQRGGRQGGGRQGGGGRGAGGRGGGRGGGVDANLQRLLRKEIPLRISANTVNEIRDMIALARELDYNLVIEGAVEGWVVAPEMSEAGVSVIYTPRQRRDPQTGREDTSGSSIESTGIFEEVGVPFATTALGSSVSLGGIAGRDLTSLPLEAAFAVRGGASNQTALESLTIVPARMLGLQDRIGSIEKGKDADILILNGQPLDYRTYVEQAIVAGEVAYDREQDLVYPNYPR